MVRAAFFGTPTLAVPALEALCRVAEVVGVICQPDRPAGRGLELRQPAVKKAALELGLEVHQPVRVKKGTVDEWLRERSTQVAVVMAYGRILPPKVLEAPGLGCINLHASLLPRYRGAAPIPWAIIRGETETGISLMQMDEGMDTGPVFSRRAIPIGSEDTAGTLGERLAELGRLVVEEDLPRALSGDLTAEPQDDRLATLAPPIDRDTGFINWSLAPKSLVDLVRGLAPLPSAWTTVRGKILKVHRACVGPDLAERMAPGCVAKAKRSELLVATPNGTSVAILNAQLEGRRPLAAADIINGRIVRQGDLLGTRP